ncbi:hypothetical protein FBY41_4528 [Humibacillus xanthopallidus]|uniref:Uncharacterized protein n=2 Tax=Humibacillus xanthopallidus TaxID=412689 RepID=A0A543HA65_9MICO|nr:hypothetical protein FBY41_4528 [Humibacillus xanthopallidus]
MLCIVNGYAQSWPLYTKNPRVHAVAILAVAEHEPQATTGTSPTPSAHPTAASVTASAEATKYATLSDAATPDHVAVFQPVVVDLPAAHRVVLRIDSVYSGTTVERLADTSLSEIEFWAAR